MPNTLLLFFAIIIAGAVSFFQYFYKNNNRSKIHLFLAILRFISIFGLLLLLINPIYSRKSYEIVKTPLAIIADNSASIIDLNANEITEELFKKISENPTLNDKFEVQKYQFDNKFQVFEKLDFKGKQSNIEQVAKNLKSIHKNILFPTVLITDGNQTSGSDFVYSFDESNKVYPIIVGDTTTVFDLKINQINVNKYAFAKNKFPVEVFLQYSGKKNINANFSILQSNSVLNKQTISFSPSKRTQIISVLLPADKVGLQVFKATILSIEKEKNNYNNNKNFAIEVIDQRTNIALISAINHPDLGAIKRSIETNVQRKVTILNPNQIKTLTDYNVLIFYQPTASFKQIFEANKLATINSFIITGTNTDFNFLAQQQTNFEFKMSTQKEDYLANFNPQFNLFALDNIGFDEFPPLQNSFGTIQSTGNVTILLSSKIRNIETQNPLLAFTENEGERTAYLFGENIWKWRLQNHISNKSFEKFDVFLDKTIQFLASNDTKKSLIVTHENFYNQGDPIEILAQYFNKNYEFDEKARLTISVVNSSTKATKKYDLLKTNNAFKVNLEGLSAGKYSFLVKELNSNSTYNASFEIIDFDIEKQFVNPDLAKLSQLATQTKGKLYHPNQVTSLIQSLIENPDYKAVQKTIIKKTPFIDWVWLLVLIALSLAIEWFVRKYHGML